MKRALIHDVNTEYLNRIKLNIGGRGGTVVYSDNTHQSLSEIENGDLDIWFVDSFFYPNNHQLCDIVGAIKGSRVRTGLDLKLLKSFPNLDLDTLRDKSSSIFTVALTTQLFADYYKHLLGDVIGFDDYVIKQGIRKKTFSGEDYITKFTDVENDIDKINRLLSETK